jgi:hypothetical protein
VSKTSIVGNGGLGVEGVETTPFLRHTVASLWVRAMDGRQPACIQDLEEGLWRAQGLAEAVKQVTMAFVS